MKKLNECTIWLYGYTQRAQKIEIQFKKNGYKVNGYIDQKAITYRESNDDIIFAPEEISPMENEIVLIMLLSVTSQIEAAKTMRRLGWKYILWGASGEEYTKSYKSNMIINYNRVLNLDFEKDIVIKEYQEKSSKNEIIKSYGNHVIVYIPLELLFCPTKNMITSINLDMHSEKWRNILSYAGKNIVRLKLYRNYFDMIFYGNSNAEEYLDNYSSISNRNRNEYLADRIQLFHIWEYEYLENGIAHFVDSAASVVWNDERKVFYIHDGIHRIMYLIYKGIYNLPVKMNKQDFLLWKNSRKNCHYFPECFERRCQQLCFIQIWSELDRNWFPFHQINKVFVVSKNYYWVEIFKDNMLNQGIIYYQDSQDIEEFHLRNSHTLYFIDSNEAVQLASKIQGNDSIIFLLVDKGGQIGCPDNTKIIYQNYNKSLICIKHESAIDITKYERK